MRTHTQIIKDAGGPHAVASALAPFDQASLTTLQTRVRAWPINGSIPGDYWALFARLGFATVEELADAADARRVEKARAQGAAA